MSPRFILRAGPDATPDGDVLTARLRVCASVQVLDRSPRMLLVAAEESELAAALQGCRGWSMVPETITPRPDPRPRVKGRPRGA
ncbi:MAG: hypothetical protein KGL78_09625 [Burkholderiales bacterium]|nr:hypothetical protein [Burkholderiales bacterium]